MAENTKYSRGGYNPRSQATIDSKAELLRQARSGELTRKEYSLAITNLKTPLKKKTFLDRDDSEFNDTEIIGSNFSQETPNTDVFPSDITGVTFIRCNLDNCNIPLGATVDSTSKNRRIAIQNDGEYWVLNNSLVPTEPQELRRFQALGMSINPRDIPTERAAEPAIRTAKLNKLRLEQRQKILDMAGDEAAMDEFIESGGQL